MCIRDRALDNIESILLDPEASPGAKAKMTQLALSYCESVENREQEKDLTLEGRNREDLIRLIREKQKQIGPILEAETTERENE